MPLHLADRSLLLSLTCLVVIASARGRADSLSLAGSWRLQIDRDDAGVEELWCARKLPESIELPGSLPSRGGAMILDDLPQPLRPIVQVVGDWVSNRKLGLVWEARFGAGRLLVTSVDLSGDLGPVRRQLRASLPAYASGDDFAPEHSVSLDAVTALIASETTAEP